MSSIVVYVLPRDVFSELLQTNGYMRHSIIKCLGLDMGFELIVGFIGYLQLVTTSNYKVIASKHI